MRKRYLKCLLLILFMSLCIFTDKKSSSAEEVITSDEVNAASDTAVTYYLGGEGASDTNDGLSSTTPFATLYKATSTINAQIDGNYEILVQGNTTETQTSNIGNYGDHGKVITIKNLTSNVYSINRGTNLEDMIYVQFDCTLILGNQNGTEDINLIINGGSTATNWPIIENQGYLKLYNGASLRNNICTGNNGSAVYNRCLFYMYGGEICNNDELNYGAINNQSTFNMYGGNIYNNHSFSDGGGVYNFGTFELYDGCISSNTCDGQGAGIYNCDRNFIMHGGIIKENVASLDAGGVSTGNGFVMENGSITANSTTFGQTGGVKLRLYGSGMGKMTGGSINGNNGIGLNIEDWNGFEVTGGSISGNIGIGVNIKSGGVLKITGGIITNNLLTGITASGDIRLGSNVSIHSNGDLSNNIVLNSDYAKIQLLSKITEPVYVTPYNYNLGNWILMGDPNDVLDSYKNICLSDTQYTLNADGRIILQGEVPNYYVGGNNASDSNSGLSSATPFATLEKAVTVIAHDTGSIIIQSDLTLTQPVVIKGTITIKSNGDLHTIKRDANYFSFYHTDSEDLLNMFIVYGNLTLGDINNTETIQNLVFHAYFNESIYVEDPADTINIEAGGEVNMYNGITLQENNKGAAIWNKGSLNMYGGIISSNKGLYAGGVYNCQNSSFLMTGGSIQDNRIISRFLDSDNYGSGGVFNKDNSTFTMSGGIISYNYGYNSGAIYNGTNCTFHMSGGSLEHNYNYIEDKAYGIFNDTGANFIIEQDAFILPEDDIWLVNGSTITVNNKLTTPDLWLIITPVSLNTSTNTYVENYVPGLQVITSGPGYNFGEGELTNIFTLNTNGYKINEQGDIIKYLQSGWVSLPQGSEYNYTGDEIKPTVVLKDGSTTLQQGIDFTVSYVNNTNIGTAHITVTGINNYEGSYTLDVAITPAIATSVITNISNLTFSARDLYNLNALISKLPSSVEVQVNGGEGSLNVDWKLTEGTFNNRGGEYTFTGTLLDGNNIHAGGLTVTARITVTPALAKVIEFDDITVPVGTNPAATAADLGESILPTRCYYSEDCSYEVAIPEIGMVVYDVSWGSQTLNTTSNKSTTTFVGTLTYVNYPNWLTIPENVTVTRTVSVTGKMNVDIKCNITNKIYDGTPVATAHPTNDQGYTGEYEINYVSTDGSNYSGPLPPKNTGNYKCRISIPTTDENYTGNVEIPFSISKKDIVIQADDKMINKNDLLPNFTYHFATGKGLLNGESLLVEPTLTAVNANTGVVGEYVIRAQGADAGNNYNIQYLPGKLTVKALTTYTINTAAGYNGRISPNGRVNVEEGSTKTFTIIPNEGYTVDKVYVDGVNIGAVTDYTFSNITADHSINPTFKTIPATDPPSDGGPVLPPPPSGGGGGPVLPPPASDSDKGATPTPTDTPDKTEKVDLIGLDGDATVSISKDDKAGSLNVEIDIPGDSSLQQQNQAQDITIPIKSSQLLEQMKNDKIQDVNITVTIPEDLQNNNKVGSINCLLGEEVLKSARNDGKDITVSVTNEEGKEQYSWTFAGSDLAGADRDITDVNLTLNVEAINNTQLNDLVSKSDGTDNSKENGKGLVINFNHHGDLPSQAKIRIYVGNQEGIVPGDQLILYYYNPQTNKFESLPYSTGYTVDSDGYVTIDILHCSDYVLLNGAPDHSVVTGLTDQINISVSNKTLYYGGTTGDTADVKITLPSTLEWIPAKGKTTNSAVGAVYVTFKSSNSSVVSVDSKGHLVTKSTGKCTISVTVTLYDGTKKTYKTTITVKKPYIVITENKATMKAGDTYTFKVSLYGYKAEDITWSTTKKSVITIDMKTGKANAVASGVAYIEAKAGKSKVKVKIVVK